MTTLMIVVLVVAAMLGSVLLVAAFRKAKQNEAGLQALAQAEGWRFEKVKETARRQGHLALSDDSAGWSLRIYSGSGQGQTSATVWTDERLALPSGLAAYAAPMPEKTQMMINLMMDKAGGLGRVLLDSVFKGLGPEAKELRMIEDDDPATLMASPGAERAFDALKGADELLVLNQFGQNIADVPYLLRNQEGLSLRLNKRLKTPEDIKRFIEAGEVLAAKF